MDYDSMTLLDLKKLCKERGLKVSGKKDEVVIRLMEYDEVLTGGVAAGGAPIPQVIPSNARRYGRYTSRNPIRYCRKQQLGACLYDGYIHSHLRYIQNRSCLLFGNVLG